MHTSNCTRTLSAAGTTCRLPSRTPASAAGKNTSRCRRVIGRRNLLLDARPVSCSDRAHIRAREACAAQRPWRVMQNTSRCRRVIGRRSTPAPLRAIEVSSEASPGDEVVSGGSLLKGPRTL